MNSKANPAVPERPTNAAQAFEEAKLPMKTFMLKHTRKPELQLFLDANKEVPETPEKVSLTPLIPAFVLSELKTAFIIGFIVFVPFLVIDLIVSASLMSMGMMMLPPHLSRCPSSSCFLCLLMVDACCEIHPEELLTLDR